MDDWTFLTGHAHVLVLLARDPRSTVTDLARRAGIAPREVREILDDLVQAGYVTRRREREATFHLIDRTLPLRHPVEAHHPVGRLLDAVETPAEVLRERVLPAN